MRTSKKTCCKFWPQPSGVSQGGFGVTPRLGYNAITHWEVLVDIFEWNVCRREREADDIRSPCGSIVMNFGSTHLLILELMIMMIFCVVMLEHRLVLDPA